MNLVFTAKFNSQGGVFVIQIAWVCNLDINFMEFCHPRYSFSRMDNPDALIAPGWNFRLVCCENQN